MFLASLSIKRPIMVSMGLLVFIVFGGLAFFALSLDLMPEVEIPYVTIQTVYPGAGPREIETQLTKKIEDAVATISKIDLIQSYSMEGASIIIIKFDIGKDVDIANQETKDKVDAILSDLPRDAERPVIEKYDINAQPVMDIVLSGNLDITDLYDIADKKLKDRFSQVEGVAKVDLLGGQEREIRVELDNRIVYQNAISLNQLSQILAVQNMNMPAGHFQKQTQEYSTRLQGEFPDLKTIEQLEIPTIFGYKQLNQIANVRDTGEEVRERTTYFDNLTKIKNENVVLLSITKSADGNTVDMAKVIQKELPIIKSELPAGCELDIVRDDSIFIESSVRDTLGNVGLGVLLTALVLLFFLHDVRSTIIASLAMPMSIISTFLLIQVADFTLNIMTLMGISTAVGILVTNSVVVLENIFRHKALGGNRKEAADKGTSEIAVAVIASTMTNIVVFLPIASMSSLVGQFFEQFALTVAFATVFSLLISFTLTPMLASLILPERDTKKHPIGRKLEAFFRSWERTYQGVLEKLLATKKRSAMVIAMSILTFVLSFFVAGQIGFEFFPLLDEGNVDIEVELPQGYNLHETAALLDEIESRIKQHREVKHILTRIGKLSQTDVGTNLARIMVKLVEERDLTSNQAANLFIRELSGIPNARIRVAAASSMGSGQAPIQFFLLGQEVDRLEGYKDEIFSKIKDTDGLINLNTSSRAGRPEITLTPERKKVADAGLTVYDLAMTLRSSMAGLVATRYRDRGEEYDIRVALTDESVDSPEKVGNIAVSSQSGTYRLSQLATVDFTEGYSKILHKDKYKTIEFTGHVAEGFALGDVVATIREEIADIDLPGGYKIDWGADVEMMEETTADMLQTFIIAILLTYMLLAAILESFTQPLMILGTVPLALVGVFSALFITGKTMNVMSMMAIVMLLGIVVNNAILILDYTNILRKKGRSVKAALIEACPTKLKPILMATVAIILGMLPMALGIGSAGKEFRQPLGIVSIGGLIVSTLLALVVIPAVYYLTTKSAKISVEKHEKKGPLP